MPSLNRTGAVADVQAMEASRYALVHGLRRTRGALAQWRAQPWPVLRAWLAGSLATAVLLLLAIWLIAVISAPAHPYPRPQQPPFVVGGIADVVRILVHNLLVLALHAMACVAGFIAGSSLPLQAEYHTGMMRVIHERGRPVAIGLVVCATCLSLTLQAHVIGTTLARVALSLHVTPALLLLSLLPHALPELVALFLPLAAWMVASRRGEWDSLLAATFVTVAIALPVLVCTAFFEVYLAPHVIAAVLGARA